MTFEEVNEAKRLLQHMLGATPETSGRLTPEQVKRRYSRVCETLMGVDVDKLHAAIRKSLESVDSLVYAADVMSNGVISIEAMNWCVVGAAMQRIQAKKNAKDDESWEG